MVLNPPRFPSPLRATRFLTKLPPKLASTSPWSISLAAFKRIELAPLWPFFIAKFPAI